MVGVLLRELRAQRLGVDEIVESLPPAVAAGRGSLDWPAFVTLLARVEQRVGGPEAMIGLGHAMCRPRRLDRVRRVLTFAVSVRQLYALSTRFLGPTSFPGTRGTMRVEPDGELHVTIEIDAALEGSLPFMRLNLGTAEAMPRILGLGDALVRAELTPHRGELRIKPPPSRSGLARLKRIGEVFRGARSAVDELAEQHEQLRRSYAELQQAHRQLVEQEARFHRIADNASEIIAEWDDGRCVWVSPSVERLLGWTPEAYRRVDPAQLMHPEDVARLGDWTNRGVRETGPSQALLRLRTRSGGWRWFEVTSTPVSLADGTRRVVSISRDVTARLDLEEQLRQSQKMEALGRLAGGVAHDFNNLLTVLTGNEEILRKALHDDLELRPAAEEIHEAVSQASALTGQLLSFSRQEVVHHSVLSLNDLVTRVDRMLRRVIGEDVGLTTRLSPGLSSVRADRGQLEQVILNLAVNARDAMPGGGELVIETAEVDVGPELAEAFGIAAGPYLRLRVADSGTGIEPEVQERMFEPFFTTKEVGRGTGLGLSTVYGILRQAGGHVAFESVPGEGSTFDVYLPRHAGAPEADDRPEPEVDPSGSETILVVEDDDAVRGVTCRMLQRYGYRALVARDADEARSVVDREGALDLLLTDVVMPGEGGPSLALQLRARRAGLKVLFVSGYARHGLPGIETPVYGDELLQKPFDALRLARRVRAVLDGPPDA